MAASSNAPSDAPEVDQQSVEINPLGTVGQKTSEILVGGNGVLWVAPNGNPSSTTTTTALDVGFIDMGFTDENGLDVTAGKTMQDILVWQSFYPARKLVSARTFQVAFALRQWDKTTLPLALGGAMSGATPNFRLDPTAPEVVDLRSFVFEWADGAKNYRLYLPVGLVQENVETKIVRTDSAILPLTIAVVDPGGVTKPWSLFTNDPAFT